MPTTPTESSLSSYISSIKNGTKWEELEQLVKEFDKNIFAERALEILNSIENIVVESLKEEASSKIKTVLNWTNEKSLSSVSTELDPEKAPLVSEYLTFNISDIQSKVNELLSLIFKEISEEHALEISNLVENKNETCESLLIALENKLDRVIHSPELGIKETLQNLNIASSAHEVKHELIPTIVPKDLLRTLLDQRLSSKEFVTPTYNKLGALIKLLRQNNVFADDIAIFFNTENPLDLKEILDERYAYAVIPEPARSSYFLMEIPKLKKAVLLDMGHGVPTFVFNMNEVDYNTWKLLIEAKEVIGEPENLDKIIEVDLDMQTWSNSLQQALLDDVIIEEQTKINISEYIQEKLEINDEYPKNLARIKHDLWNYTNVAFLREPLKTPSDLETSSFFLKLKTICSSGEELSFQKFLRDIGKQLTASKNKNSENSEKMAPHVVLKNLRELIGFERAPMDLEYFSNKDNVEKDLWNYTRTASYYHGFLKSPENLNTSHMSMQIICANGEGPISLYVYLSRASDAFAEAKKTSSKSPKMTSMQILNKLREMIR